MDNRFTKYSKLYFLIFLSFLAVPLVIAVLLSIFYGFSALVSSKPFDFIYALIVIALPATIFCTVYYIFIWQTKKHPSTIIKIISQILFAIGLCCCIIVVVADTIIYFKSANRFITDYKSFSLAFLAGNIALLFIVAMLQALTTTKEKDWMDRQKMF